MKEIKEVSKIDRIIEQYSDVELMIADGFDEAIIGVDEKKLVIIYSSQKCIEILSKSMSQDEAYEYFTYNVEGSYIGEQTPIFCWEI